MDAGNTTYFLKHWVREEGLLDLPQAVQKITGAGADLFGIAERGVLRPGAFADLNVIDFERLELFAPRMVDDLPLGASRFTQRARGYDFTLVNGVVLVESDELTGELPGRLVTAV